MCSKCNKSSCNQPTQSQRPSCVQRLRMGWIPESACTMFYELDGIAGTIDMSQVHACSPVTHMRWNDDKCRIEFLNEDYVSSNGTKGAIEYINATTIAGCIELEDLANVIDKEPHNCDLLVWKDGDECGDGCTSAGAGWQAYTIPYNQDCVIEPNENGMFPVLVKNDEGCIEACNLMPTGLIYQHQVRDSWPDSHDWPYHYGNYDEVIKFYLADNAPLIFGKFDLKVTIEYTFMTEQPDAGFEASVKSITIPFFDNNVPNLAGDLTPFKTLARKVELLNALPWGTRATSVTRVVIVPKGKELSLFHMVRMRANFADYGGVGWPDPFPTPYDGQRMTATGVDTGLTNFSRLNATDITIEPVIPVTQATRFDDGAGDRTPNTLDPFVPGDIVP